MAEEKQKKLNWKKAYQINYSKLISEYKLAQHYMQYFPNAKYIINEILGNMVKHIEKYPLETLSPEIHYYLAKIKKIRFHDHEVSNFHINQVKDNFKSLTQSNQKTAAKAAVELAKIYHNENDPLDLYYAALAFINDYKYASFFLKYVFPKGENDYDDLGIVMFLTTLATASKTPLFQNASLLNRIKFSSKYKIIPDQTIVFNLYNKISAMQHTLDMNNPESFIQMLRDTLSDTQNSFYRIASTPEDEQHLTHNIIQDIKTAALNGDKLMFNNFISILKTGACPLLEAAQLPLVATNPEATESFLIECSKTNIQGAYNAYEYTKKTNQFLATEILLNGIFLSKITDTNFAYPTSLATLTESSFLQSPENAELRNVFKNIQNGKLVRSPQEFKQLKDETFAAFERFKLPQELKAQTTVSSR